MKSHVITHSGPYIIIKINSPLNSDFGDIEVKAGKGDRIAEQYLQMLSRLQILKCLLSCFPIYHNSWHFQGQTRSLCFRKVYHLKKLIHVFAEFSQGKVLPRIICIPQIIRHFHNSCKMQTKIRITDESWENQFPI